MEWLSVVMILVRTKKDKLWSYFVSPGGMRSSSNIWNLWKYNLSKKNETMGIKPDNDG